LSDVDLSALLPSNRLSAASSNRGGQPIVFSVGRNHSVYSILAVGENGSTGRFRYREHDGLPI